MPGGPLLDGAGRGAATLQPVGSFNSPIFITSPPGDPRLFVVERGGTIEVLHDGVQSQFLDIHDLTTEEGERGLLSMAFAPTTPNGLFYVFYTGTAAADGQGGSATSTSSTPARIPTSPTGPASGTS